MARLTPHALATGTPRPYAGPLAYAGYDDAARRKRRIERQRKEDRWADDRIMAETRRLMTGRHGVRL